MINQQSRILFLTHTEPHYMPPPMYSENMIICGPRYPTRMNQKGEFISLQTPSHKAYDVAQLVAGLPAQQKPDLVITRIDAWLANYPVNVAQLKIPSIAIFGDTHHMEAPLQKMLPYALRERYTWNVLDHNLQHAHWYLEAGLRNLVWIPALLLAEHFTPPVSDPVPELMFVGQVGPLHPQRTRVVEAIQAAGIPLNMQTVPMTEAHGMYNRHSLTFNCSLNGDFNLRVFETMAAGGALVTDRLSPASGLSQLFTEGEDYLAYSSNEELVELCQRYLADPEARNRIAEAGYRNISERFSLESRRGYLSALLSGTGLPAEFSAMNDPRIRAYGCHSKQDLLFRIRFYEWVQEQHRTYEHVAVHAGPAADLRMLCDVADLPRLRLSVAPDHPNMDLLEKAGVAPQVLKQKGPQEADRVICLSSITNLVTALSFKPDALMLTDWTSVGPEEQAIAAKTVMGNALSPSHYANAMFQRSKRWSDSKF